MHGWSWDVMSLAPSVVFFPSSNHVGVFAVASKWAHENHPTLWMDLQVSRPFSWRSSSKSRVHGAVGDVPQSSRWNRRRWDLFLSTSWHFVACAGKSLLLFCPSLVFFSVFLSCWFFLLFFLFRFFFWGESSTSRARADGALATNASWWPASHVHPYMVLDDMTGLSDSFEASMLLSRSTVDFLMAPFLVVHGGCCCCWWWWCCCLLLVCAVFFCFFLAMHYLSSAWGLCPAGEEMCHARDGLGGCQQRWTGTVHASRNRSCRLS